MVSLAVPGQGVGEGQGRVVRLWGNNSGGKGDQKKGIRQLFSSDLKKLGMRNQKVDQPDYVSTTLSPPRILQTMWVVTSTIVKCQASGVEYHQPYRWSLIRCEDQQVIQTKITPGAPSFTAYLCDLVPIRPCVNKYKIYFCPRSNLDKEYCNHPGHYYCAY